jgi:hypothetical protein
MPHYDAKVFYVIHYFWQTIFIILFSSFWAVDREKKILDKQCGISLQVPIILQQYCFPHNYGNCYAHIISQYTEKETTSLSIFLLTIKLNYLHDLKLMV